MGYGRPRRVLALSVFHWSVQCEARFCICFLLNVFCCTDLLDHLVDEKSWCKHEREAWVRLPSPLLRDCNLALRCATRASVFHVLLSAHMSRFGCATASFRTRSKTTSTDCRKTISPRALTGLLTVSCLVSESLLSRTVCQTTHLFALRVFFFSCCFVFANNRSCLRRSREQSAQVHQAEKLQRMDRSRFVPNSVQLAFSLVDSHQVLARDWLKSSCIRTIAKSG